MPTVFFFCDAAGRVAQAHAGELKDWDLPPGTDLCHALGLVCTDNTPLTARFAPQTAHTLTSPTGQPMTLQVIELPESLAPAGGFLVTLRFSAQLAIFRAASEPDAPGPSAATLDYALFNAVFNDARDAILLTDEHFTSSPPTARPTPCTPGRRVTDRNTLPPHPARRGSGPGLASVRALKNGASWRCTIATLGPTDRKTRSRSRSAA
jgi:hypothetical protein